MSSISPFLSLSYSSKLKSRTYAKDLSLATEPAFPLEENRIEATGWKEEMREGREGGEGDDELELNGCATRETERSEMDARLGERIGRWIE